MASSRNIIVAGAGIGGLAVALMLARSGFRVLILEQAKRLEESGAGIQLSPNATRVLLSLGLGERLAADASTPQAITIRTAAGRRLARVPLGEAAERRYGAPYWSIHRADLQATLLDAIYATPDVTLRLDARVEDYAVHAHGVTVACRRGLVPIEEHCGALICADGLWSGLRARLDHHGPQFANRTAWRAMLPAEMVEDEFRSAEVQLWLGRNAHLVHYPVKSGRLINVVAIVSDRWDGTGWSAEGSRDELLSHYSSWTWSAPAREFLALPSRWFKWALYDLPQLDNWSDGPVTLLGDAAHAMLPFLAQGAAMAIEDAAVLTDCLVREPNDPATAFRRYQRRRRRRTARVQRAARSTGKVYHQASGEALARNLFLRLTGGKMLLRRYNWLYDWRAPAPSSVQDPGAFAGAGDR